MSTFKAKYIQDHRFYKLRKLNFLYQIPSGLALGSFAGGIISGTNWTLIISGIILYAIIAYFTYTRLKEFTKLYDAMPQLKVNETELMIHQTKDGDVKKIPLNSADSLHIQIRATTLRERILDYFREDYVKRSANYIILNDIRYDFVIDSHYSLGKLIGLFPVWEKAGIQLSWDFEKAFQKELQKEGLEVNREAGRSI